MKPKERIKEIEKEIEKGQCPDCSKKVKLCKCNYKTLYVTMPRDKIVLQIKQAFEDVKELKFYREKFQKFVHDVKCIDYIQDKKIQELINEQFCKDVKRKNIGGF